VQKSPQPREDQAEIVAYRAQYGVRGVALATLQIAAAEVAIALMCPMTASIAERRLPAASGKTGAQRLGSSSICKPRCPPFRNLASSRAAVEAERV